jgi:hypothetical protein
MSLIIIPCSPAPLLGPSCTALGAQYTPPPTCFATAAPAAAEADFSRLKVEKILFSRRGSHGSDEFRVKFEGERFGSFAFNMAVISSLQHFRFPVSF